MFLYTYLSNFRDLIRYSIKSNNVHISNIKDFEFGLTIIVKAKHTQCRFKLKANSINLLKNTRINFTLKLIIFI